MIKQLTVAIAMVTLAAAAARAQELRPFEVGAQIVATTFSELETHDVGVSGRVAWNVLPILGVEGEIGVFPGDIPESRPISANRIEGAFGVTVGPRLGAFRPFVRLRPGFLRVGAAPAPVACILIFPPPLSCTLAAGRTLSTLEIGGGVEANLSESTFARIDVGDRRTMFPGQAIDADGRIHTESFSSRDLRVGVGIGWRF
jgi:hypothetical protein